MTVGVFSGVTDSRIDKMSTWIMTRARTIWSTFQTGWGFTFRWLFLGSWAYGLYLWFDSTSAIVGRPIVSLTLRDLAELVTTVSGVSFFGYMLFLFNFDRNGVPVDYKWWARLSLYLFVCAFCITSWLAKN